MLGLEREIGPTITRDNYVKLVMSTLWENLPQVIGGGLLFTLCSLPAFLLFGIGLLAPTIVVAVITVGPAWCALLALADQLLQGKTGGFTRFWHTLWHHGRAAALLSMLLAFPLLIGLTTLPLLQLDPVPLVVWAGLAADLLMIGLVLAVLFYAMPLLLDGQRARLTLLRSALHLASIYPANTVGLLALGLLLLLAVAYLSMGLLLLLPAIYALFVAANYQLVQNSLPHQTKRR